MRKPETERYGWASIVLHWLGAVALVFSFTTGDPLEDLTGVERLSAYDNHVLWATILVHRSRQMIHRALEQPVVLYSESGFHCDGSD